VQSRSLGKRGAFLNEEINLDKEKSKVRASLLRKRAEKILSKNPQDIQAPASSDILKLIHELNIQQIELGIQNEETRRLQLVLDETRDRFQQLYDYAPTGFFTLNPNSLIAEVNLTGSKLLGTEKHQLIGTSFTAYISTDSQDNFQGHQKEVFKTGHEGNCEIKMLKADNTLFHAQLRSIPVMEKEGKINFIRTAVTDITERKKSEETLRASEENFRNSMNNSPLGIRIVSESGQTLYANQAILDIYGYHNTEELNLITVNQRFTPASYAELCTRREKREHSKPAEESYEISIVRLDGTVRRLQVFQKEVLWGGKPHFQIIYQDITERKQAEEMAQAIT